MTALLLLWACGPRVIYVLPPLEDTAAETTVDQGAFESAERCAVCHPVEYGEWRLSMHAYAARSPVFDAMNAKAVRDSAGQVDTFCVGCHTPQGVFSGEAGNSVAAIRTEAALEGVTCDVCHTAIGHDGVVGNAAIERDLTSGVKQGPFGDAVATVHGSEAGEFLSSSALCGSCHDVFAYPGLEIEQAYTEHLDSPAALEGQRCQDCHMSPEPGVVAAREEGPIAVVEGEVYPDRPRAPHRFVGPDYALIDDFPYPDDPEASAAAQAEYLELVQRLLENSVRISDLRADTDEEGHPAIVVELESLVAGHRVPTGFTSERQLWIALDVYDAGGQLLWQTGNLDQDGNLRDHHSLQVLAGQIPSDELLVNLQSTNLLRAKQFGENGIGLDGEAVDPLQTWDTIFPFDANTIIRQSLEPLEKRSFSFISNDPKAARVEVTLRYRNLPPYLLQALQVEELIERLHIFDLDSASLDLQ